MKLLLAPIETINTNCPHGVSSYSNVGATRYNMGAYFFMKVYRDDNPNDKRCELIHEILIHSYYYLTEYIDKIVDHEGQLTVYWLKIPHEYDKKIIKDIWNIFNEECLEHVYVELIFHKL